MNRSFRENVYTLVSSIPSGRVMTYGQIAVLCGHPGAAQAVGQIAHFGPSLIPWHRVVNANGGLARGYPCGGPEGQADQLKKEGITIDNYQLRLENYIWWPKT
jgi:methylated-DNA-protein-cysteine methyltransferase related protein